MRDPSKLDRIRRLAAVAAVLGAAWLLQGVPALAQEDAQGAPEAAQPAEGAPEATEDAAQAQDAPQAEGEPQDAQEAPAARAAGGGRKGAVSSRSNPAKKRRGDVNPCLTPDPGWGVYDPWSREPSIGQMIMPHKGGVTKSGSFDVMIHFHGHEPLRKEFVKTAKGIVLVGIDLGIGSGAYANAFGAPNTFEKLLASIEAAVLKKTGKKKVRIRKLALSAWSAGYGAIEQILRQPAGKKVDALILLDSLHAGYADEQAKTLKVAPIDPFIQFARRAAAGKAFMYMSHSSIVPPGYASTSETASFIVQQLKGKLKSSIRQDVLGLDMIQRYDRGDFHVRGYTGDDKPDHCAHIGLIADVIRVHLNPRWKPPKGRR